MLKSDMQSKVDKPSCFRLLRHLIVCALDLAAASAGSNSPARIAMMAMTTSPVPFPEPENAFVDFHGLTHFRFMGREQVRKEHGALHEPRSSRRQEALAQFRVPQSAFEKRASFTSAAAVQGLIVRNEHSRV